MNDEFSQYTAVISFSGLTFSPDAQWVAYLSNISGQSNVWRQPTVQSVNDYPLMPIQLTNASEHSIRQLVWSPTGERILVLVDTDGKENYQIYEVPTEQGWYYPTTDKPQVRHELGPAPFSRDGKCITYSANERKEDCFDVIIHNLVTNETKNLFIDDGIYFAVAWHPDQQHILVLKYNQSTDQDLFLYEINTNTYENLTPHKNKTKFLPIGWNPLKPGLFILSNSDREFTSLAFLDINDNTLNWLITPEWDVESAAISWDGRYIVWVVNENGYSQLYMRDQKSGAIRKYDGLPDGVYSNLVFSPQNYLLGLYVSTPICPRNLYIIDIQTGKNNKMTQSFIGGIPETKMIQPETIYYPSFDGLQVPALLYRPANTTAERQTPMIIAIHGGPELQERPQYSYGGLYQYLLSRNIGILAPNIRGSTGYGKTYEQLIHRDWGGNELKDLEYAALYLNSLKWTNPDRFGVFGESFGGFATLSCITRLPNYWAAAVDLMGPANLISFIETASPFWRKIREESIGSPVKDFAALQERSPIRHIENLKAPLLIIQGANDPRVPKTESDQMVERLTLLGKTTRYEVFPNEGHVFNQVANRTKALRLSAQWFEKYLL